MQASLEAWVRVDASRIAARVEERVRRFIDEYRPRFVYVMFSGGKDSATALAAAMRVAPNRVVAVFSHIVGQTHHLNLQAALETAKHLGMRVRVLRPGSPGELRLALLREPPRPPELLVVVVSYRHGLSYWDAVLRYGFPAPAERFGRGLRWCCSEFKEKWWHELPANTVYNGRPAKALIAGVKASDSPYRAKRWKQPVNIFRAAQGQYRIALAPLYDLRDHHVWSLLRHYGLYETIHKQYEVFGHSPNCVLCPLMNMEAFEKTIRVLPKSYLKRVLDVLVKVRGRYRDGTFSATRLDKWIRMIREVISDG